MPVPKSLERHNQLLPESRWACLYTCGADSARPCARRGYPLSARLACFLAKAMQYGTVGLVMGTTGSSLVLGLTFLRTALDKEYQPPPTYQPVLGTGLGWLLFMSGSSNVRYNLINLAEDLAYER